MYRRCLAVNPEHSYALYNLAVLKEETTKNGDYSEVGRHGMGRFLSALTSPPLPTRYLDADGFQRLTPSLSPLLTEETERARREYSLILIRCLSPATGLRSVILSTLLCPHSGKTLVRAGG